MKRLTIIILVSLILIYISDSHAFNPAAHLYIAERVFQSQDLDLYYGSIAPDMALYADQEKWPASFEDTHYTYIDLRPYAIGYAQRAFSSGWLTHNEVYGADYYAHRVNPIGNNICATNLFHSFSDWNLLARVFVWREKRTDLLTLATAELTFRNLINRYATALALPDPYNKKALAQLGSQLAMEMFGIKITEEDTMRILEAALLLCEGDYKDAIDNTINEIKNLR